MRENTDLCLFCNCQARLFPFLHIWIELAQRPREHDRLFQKVLLLADTFYFICLQCQSKKKSTPLKYEVGDLIWAKFKRRPWWPCRICSDPLINTHSKMKGTSCSCFVFLIKYRCIMKSELPLVLASFFLALGKHPFPPPFNSFVNSYLYI